MIRWMTVQISHISSGDRAKLKLLGQLGVVWLLVPWWLHKPDGHMIIWQEPLLCGTEGSSLWDLDKDVAPSLILLGLECSQAWFADIVFIKLCTLMFLAYFSEIIFGTFLFLGLRYLSICNYRQCWTCGGVLTHTRRSCLCIYSQNAEICDL